MNNACKLLLLVWVTPFYCNACPGCVGAVDEDSAPFFSDDCYQPSQKANDQISQHNEKGTSHE